MAKTAPVKVGAIGTGRIYNHAHLPVYPALFEKARLVGFFDLSPERAASTKDNHEAKLRELAEQRPELAKDIEQNIAALTVHTSLDSLLESVDAVDIATHARGRMPSAIAAFGAGVSAVAEKPMGRTWTETDRAVRALRDAGGKAIFQLNDDNVFDPKYRFISSILARGEIGRVQHVTLIRGCNADADNLLPAEVTALENGGGAMQAYGSHGLAGALSLFWPASVPIAVEAVSIRRKHPDRVVQGTPMRLEVDDNAQIKVKMHDAESGSWATVFFEATIVGGHIGLTPTHGGGQSNGFLQIIGDKGMITTEASDSMQIRYWNGGVEEIPLLTFAGESISFVTEFSEFFDAYRAGAEPLISAEFGSNVIAVCGAGYLSAKEGGAVTLDHFKEYSRSFVAKYGDNTEADDAVILDLLEPYRD